MQPAKLLQKAGTGRQKVERVIISANQLQQLHANSQIRRTYTAMPGILGSGCMDTGFVPAGLWHRANSELESESMALPRRHASAETYIIMWVVCIKS